MANPYTKVRRPPGPTLNRNLFVFSLFLVVVGLGSGLYLISFFGLLLLIPALVSPSQAPGRRGPPQSPQQPRSQTRVPLRQPAPRPPSTAQVPMSEPPSAQPMTLEMSSTPSPMQPISYAPALFPSTMFPSLSTMGSTGPPAMVPQEAKREGRDELVEVGAMLALLKLVFG